MLSLIYNDINYSYRFKKFTKLITNNYSEVNHIDKNFDYIYMTERWIHNSTGKIDYDSDFREANIKNREQMKKDGFAFINERRLPQPDIKNSSKRKVYELYTQYVNNNEIDGIHFLSIERRTRNER